MIIFYGYMINCNENENVNGKIDQINNSYKDLDVDIKTNINNMTYLGTVTPLCNKQHLNNFWRSIQLSKQLSNTEAELKKSVAYKKAYVWLFKFFRVDFLKLKSQGQIWDILLGVSSLRVYFIRKIFSLIWAVVFGKCFLLVKNLNQVHMTYSFLELLIFFLLVLV